MLCVRNTQLETLHAGQGPITWTGDYSDVFVVDADGRRIPWSDVSRIDDAEMRELMRDVVNRVYTFHMCADEPSFRDDIDRRLSASEKCDEPTLEAMSSGDVRAGK